MISIQSQLEELVRRAMAAALGPAGAQADPLVRRSQEPRLGDYQSNAAMGLGKALGRKPRDVAEEIAGALRNDARFREMCEPPQVAGPGFINLRLRPAWLSGALSGVPAAPEAGPDRLGIEPVGQDGRLHVVVDYSGVNVAKQMHVGHLRSTIIGDVIVRVLSFEGHVVTRRNHVGDWGLQMGQMLRRIAPKRELLLRLDRGDEAETGPQPQRLDDASVCERLAGRLEQIEEEYKAAQAEEKTNPALAEESRHWVVRLQTNDRDARQLWEWVRGGTLAACQHIYDRLGVLLTMDDVRGESFYADMLPDVVEELRARLRDADGPAVVREDQGALCVFHRDEQGRPRFRGPDGEPLPLIIRKSDGAFLYATTDLAALRYRIRQEHADRIIYVTDPRQTLHFEMVFATAQAAGWTHRPGRPPVRLDHVTFGAVLGEDRRPLKTRSGENVKLKDLLDEAVERAERLVRANEQDPSKRRGFSEEQIRDIAEAVGIGAVKYADLSQNRTSDYVFSWDKMLAMEGNTAPYLMYAYARIRSIYAKSRQANDEASQQTDPARQATSDSGPSGGAGAARDPDAARSDGSEPAGQTRITLHEPAEVELARRILQFGETIDSVAEDLKPNVLTSYLYDLAGAFMRFYESCPVLRAATAALRKSRLRLCELTARTLRTGLDLLGIRVVERM